MSEEIKKTEVKETDPMPPFQRIGEARVVEKAEVTQEDKERFFKCFLADKPFTEEISLFSGKYKVKFTSLTAEQGNDVFHQISLDQEKGIAKNSDSYYVKIITYRLAVALLEVNGSEFASEITKENNEEEDGVSFIKVRARIFDNWQAYKLASVLEAYKQFESKVSQLTEAVLTPDFWKAAA